MLCLGSGEADLVSELPWEIALFANGALNKYFYNFQFWLKSIDSKNDVFRPLALKMSELRPFLCFKWKFTDV